MNVWIESLLIAWERNPDAAARTIRGILQKADLLARFPEMGPPLTHRQRDDLRVLLFGHYRIIYGLENTAVTIYAVHHTSRDLDQLL